MEKIFFLYFNFKARFHVELITRISIRNTKFYSAPYGKINHGLVNLSYNCDMISGLRSVAQLKIKGATQMLLYHGKQLWSYREGQLPYPHCSWPGLDLPRG